jgi:hypothetical protein
MPVLTVMAENTSGHDEKLHKEAVRVVRARSDDLSAVSVERLRNIKIYKETEEIELRQLIAEVAAEKARDN